MYEWYSFGITRRRDYPADPHAKIDYKFDDALGTYQTGTIQLPKEAKKRIEDAIQKEFEKLL